MSLKISGLSHQVDDGNQSRPLLAEINLSVNQGNTIALMGDSGSGKTTLLNLISGLEPIQQGNICLSGKSLSLLSEKGLSQLRQYELGIIFQQFNLVPTLSALENVTLPMIFQGMEREARRSMQKANARMTGVGPNTKTKTDPYYSLGQSESKSSFGGKNRTKSSFILNSRSIFWDIIYD